MEFQYQQRLDLAIAAAQAAGEELLHRRESALVSEKSPRDLVTDADLAAQELIQRMLENAFPSDAFMGEEAGATIPPQSVVAGLPDAPPCWIVDPLDGTVNYVHRLQSFAVSIGLYAAGELQVGVVYDPVSNEMFHAFRGGGAFVNGQNLRSSQCSQLDQALVACSFAPRIAADSPEIERFLRMLPRCRAIRRLGSCALNLCYVAAGRLDAYWAASVKTWDAAAGALIAEEAGAIVTSLDGSEIDLWQPRFIASANRTLNDQIVACLNA